MTSLYYSTATAETGRNSPLHCPSCRCQQLSPFRQTNLYLSPNCPSNDNLTMTFNPMRSLFSRTDPTLAPLHQLSPNKCSITFCYTSPIYLKKHHSSESRFNTKKFKETHFPFLKEKSLNEQPVFQILKSKSKPMVRPKCPERGPQEEARPNILKMNRMKGLKRSNKNISSNSSQSLNMVSKTNSLNQHLSSDLNEQEILPQQDTPIDLFKLEIAPKQYELQANSKQSKEELIKNSKQQKEYPSAESIEVFKVQEKGREGPSETSVKVEDHNVSKQWKQVETDREIASSIHDDLDLNFDYYILHCQTDRSISDNLEL